MDEQAVIDRFVDDAQAVLLVGEQEIEHIVPVTALPPGAQPGTWLNVRFDGDTLVEAVVDEVETERVRERLSEKMNRLRSRGRRVD
ncbi:MAG: DUF3006 domain-containing protein [Dehalococcoidia bacterium]